MLTKTLKFDDDVLAVLKAMKWSDNGTLGVITGGQLDRKLYVKLNKALQAMGGKWNRKAGGHIFKSDPRKLVDGLLDNGELVVARDGFFETPASIVSRMKELVSPYGLILEPSAGLGAIADNLDVPQDKILCVEQNQERATALMQKGYETFCLDFLKFTTSHWFDTIFMNPPFENRQDIDHIQYAFSLLREGGSLVSVMSEGPFFGSDSKAKNFRDWLNSVNKKKKKLPEGSFNQSGTGVNTRLVVIHNVAG